MTIAEYGYYMKDACRHEAVHRIDAAWACLEAAHVLGQSHTRDHVLAHRSMLGLAWRQRDPREFVGQLFRWIAAAAVTWLWMPSGNTGRARINPFRPEPIPKDLAVLLDAKMNVTTQP